jgi:hypothetical protein
VANHPSVEGGRFPCKECCHKLLPMLASSSTRAIANKIDMRWME